MQGGYSTLLGWSLHASTHTQQHRHTPSVSHILCTHTHTFSSQTKLTASLQTLRPVFCTRAQFTCITAQSLIPWFLTFLTVSLLFIWKKIDILVGFSVGKGSVTRVNLPSFTGADKDPLGRAVLCPGSLGTGPQRKGGNGESQVTFTSRARSACACFLHGGANTLPLNTGIKGEWGEKGAVKTEQYKNLRTEHAVPLGGRRT